MTTYTDVKKIRKNLASKLPILSKLTRNLAFVILATIVIDIGAITILHRTSPERVVVFSAMVIAMHITAFILVYRKNIYTVFELATTVIPDSLRLRLSPRASARETLEDQRTTAYKTYEKIAKLLGVQASWIA